MKTQPNPSDREVLAGLVERAGLDVAERPVLLLFDSNKLAAVVIAMGAWA